MKKRIILLILYGILAPVALYFGLIHLQAAKTGQRTVAAMKSEIHRCQAILAKDEKHLEVPLHLEFSDQSYSHGIVLEIRLDGISDTLPATHQQAMERLNLQPGTAKCLNGDQLLVEANLAVNVSLPLRRDGGFVYIPIAFLPGRLAGDSLRLVLDFPQPLTFTAPLQARYEFCSILLAGNTLSKWFAIFCMALALVFAYGFIHCFLQWHAIHSYQRLLQKPSTKEETDILYLLTSYPNASETFIRQDLRLLLQRGCRLRPVALWAGDCPRQPDWPDVTILSPHSPAFPATSATRSRLLTKWIPQTLRVNLSLIRHHRLRKRLYWECKACRIRHIHAEFADLAALMAAHVARRLGISYSIGIHAFDIHQLKYPPSLLFHKAAFVTVCNQAAADAFTRNDPRDASKLILLRHGVVLEEHPFLEERPSIQPPRLLFVGRLIEKKGVALLLDALALLRKQMAAPLHLTIIGDGPLRSALQEQATTLGLDDLITWTGSLPHDHVLKAMAEATCLCVPSIVTADGDRDGIPNVLAEAMAVGLPVVGSQVGSLSELLTDDTGWPVDRIAPHSLADGIADLLAHPDEQEKRRRKARQLLEKRFNASRFAATRARLFP